MIVFEGVTKRYPGGTVAVDNLSLEVPTGEISVFVGPSGCGKTTSLRMINRMIDPTEGRVLLDGRDVREIDPPTLRRGIGYVIQHGGLFPHRRILDNIATVPYLLGWDKKKARDRARELMERVGLDAELARYPREESPVADALAYADQTTGPTGDRVTVEERLAEVLVRHGPGSAHARAHRLRGPYLLEVGERVERRLRGATAEAMALAARS